MNNHIEKNISKYSTHRPDHGLQMRHLLPQIRHELGGLARIHLARRRPVGIVQQALQLQDARVLLTQRPLVLLPRHGSRMLRREPQVPGLDVLAQAVDGGLCVWCYIR